MDTALMDMKPCATQASFTEQADAHVLPRPRPHPLPNDPTHPRLGLPAPLRIPITTAAACSVGLLLGASHGSSVAAFKFRAENAHRLPKSTLQWYQYHRSKNYRAMVGGLKEGSRMGFKLGLGVACFALFEETCDRARHGNKDFLSTVTAGLTFSGVYSLIYRHDIYTTARAAKLGLKASLAYGLAQDLLATAKGNPPSYLARLLGKKDTDRDV